MEWPRETWRARSRKDRGRGWPGGKSGLGRIFEVPRLFRAFPEKLYVQCNIWPFAHFGVNRVTMSGAALDLIESDEELGPAMASLNGRQREFVRAWVALGYQGIKDAGEAARKAGYVDSGTGAIRVIGHRLAHDPRVQAAILEVSKKEAVLGAASVGLPVVIEIALNKKLKPDTRLRAAGMLLNRGGMPEMTEQKITVEHKADSSQLAEFARQLADELQIDRKKLLGWEGMAAKVVEAEVVEPAAAAPPVEDGDEPA